MSSTKETIRQLIIMLGEAPTPTSAMDWATELLRDMGDDGDPMQRAYLHTICGLSLYNLGNYAEAVDPFIEAQRIADQHAPLLAVMVAWYTAHTQRAAAMQQENGVEPTRLPSTQACLNLSTMFHAVAVLATTTNMPLIRGLAYSVSAEYALHGGDHENALRLAGESTIGLGMPGIRPDDDRIGLRHDVNTLILARRWDLPGEPSDVDILMFDPRDLLDILPGE